MTTANEIQLTYKPILDHTIKLDRPEKVEKYIRTVISDNFISEEAVIIFLNAGLNPLGYKHLSIGCLTGCIVDVSLICTAALLTRCNAVILSHSHPSGQTKPSVRDNQVTKQLKDALKLFDIVLFDHFIITPGSYYSYADDGNL
jgi:DNA repair protein RadC